MPRTRFYEFKVTGESRFPLDMLRYDSCWPHHQEDVSTLGMAINRYPTGNRPIRLVSSVKPPTIDRWASFGWRCFDIKEVK